MCTESNFSSSAKLKMRIYQKITFVLLRNITYNKSQNYCVLYRPTVAKTKI